MTWPGLNWMRVTCVLVPWFDKAAMDWLEGKWGALGRNGMDC